MPYLNFFMIIQMLHRQYIGEFRQRCFRCHIIAADNTNIFEILSSFVDWQDGTMHALRNVHDKHFFLDSFLQDLEEVTTTWNISFAVAEKHNASYIGLEDGFQLKS